MSFPAISNNSKAVRYELRALSASTTNAEIEEAAAFSDKDQEWLNEVTSFLSAGAASVADLTALIGWVESIAGDCETTATALSDTPLSDFRTLSNTTVMNVGLLNCRRASYFQTSHLNMTWSVGTPAMSFGSTYLCLRIATVTPAAPPSARSVAISSAEIEQPAIRTDAPLKRDGLS